jgi:hypothetical protein
MNTIVYNLIPGGKKGQMSYEERVEKAKKYIQILKDDGKSIVSETWDNSKVTIVTED